MGSRVEGESAGRRARGWGERGWGERALPLLRRHLLQLPPQGTNFAETRCGCLSLPLVCKQHEDGQVPASLALVWVTFKAAHSTRGQAAPPTVGCSKLVQLQSRSSQSHCAPERPRAPRAIVAKEEAGAGEESGGQGGERNLPRAGWRCGCLTAGVPSPPGNPCSESTVGPSRGPGRWPLGEQGTWPASATVSTHRSGLGDTTTGSVCIAVHRE